MRKRLSWTFPALALAIVLGSLAAGPSSTRADFIVTGNFGPNGDVGFVNSPSNLSITFGSTGNGSIYQMDGFVNAAGMNLNNSGDGFGTSQQLTNGPPTNVGYTFSASQPTAHELLLTYTFVNHTGAALPGFQFMSFVDGDIGPNFADEWATTSGSPGPGWPNPTPHTYQVDDPTFGTIFTNLQNGTLDNTNHSSPTNPINVSMALGFSLGSIANGATAQIQVLLSDDGSTLGGLTLTQHDPVFADTLTMSGRITLVPEPASFVLLGGGLLGAAGLFRRPRRSPLAS